MTNLFKFSPVQLLQKSSQFFKSNLYKSYISSLGYVNDAHLTFAWNQVHQKKCFWTFKSLHCINIISIRSTNAIRPLYFNSAFNNATHLAGWNKSYQQQFYMSTKLAQNEIESSTFVTADKTNAQQDSNTNSVNTISNNDTSLSMKIINQGAIIEEDAQKLEHPTMEEILSKLTKSLVASKGKDLIVVETKKKTPLCDYMIFITGMNKRHLKVLANRAKKYLESVGQGPCLVEVDDDWGLCDSGKEIMVHCFTEEGRQLYQLDRKWVLQPSEDTQGRVYGDDMIGKRILSYRRNHKKRKKLQKAKGNVFIPI